MVKKIISIIVLVMYLHGMSGYTMSFHKCTITGFENIYAGFGIEDPCEEMANDCHETSPHFEMADCCDVQQTFVTIDDDSNISCFKATFFSPFTAYTFVQSYFIEKLTSAYYFNNDIRNITLPELSNICVFRI